MDMSRTGTILRVDLTKRTTERDSTARYVKDFIGGCGIGNRIFWDEVSPDTRAFDPENALMFDTGPLTGTFFGNKGNFSSKTPEEANHPYVHVGIGGQFPSEVKYAGYDHLIIKGKAETPSYLFINNDIVEIRDAKHLWGLDVHETQRKIKEELKDPDVQIACIGPAGENLVVYALILHEIQNTSSKHGLGAVMGSKNLKAIAVRGTKGLKIANPKEFMTLYDEFFDYIKTGKARLFARMLHQEGLGRQIPEDYKYAYGVPIPDEVPYSPMKAFMKKYLVRPIGCAFCPIQCAELYSMPGVGNGGTQCVNYFGLIYQGAYTGADLKLWFKRTLLANRYGLDSLSVDMLANWLMELYKEGIITAADTDGIPFEYGSEEAMIALIEKLAKGEGFGKLLADGIYPASQKIGKNSFQFADQYDNSFPYGRVEYAPDIGPVSEYRIGEVERMPGFADGYGNINAFAEIDGISPKEAAQIIDNWCDEASERVTGDKNFWRTPVYSKKYSKFTIEKENAFLFNDISGHCEVPSDYLDHYGMSFTFPHYLKWLTADTGEEYTEAQLRETANRVRMSIDAYNAACSRMLGEKPVISKPLETLPSFPIPGRPKTAEELKKVQIDYCVERGYDPETGIPTREGLEKLGLKFIADKFDSISEKNSAAKGASKTSQEPKK